ncbi:ABC transporter ATP-binding protein [Salinarimonas soli]|uniref:ABC transporter ATP-binding protein n=1 Tax=Salinarimonas soli TaxID=1638099 RepID=A0A5B2VU08_9HYPH|nr:ABC transporter ATP-binding protein [Salinarimonas soli]KAA2242088.1 ABC transporter ATP-binding protein [Salinarimonas soli]
MARLTLDAVTRTFGAFHALDRVSLDVRDGEFLAVLGPSGCGKTTLLRAVAGFEKVNGGTIAIGGRVVSSGTEHVPPERRRVGIVFQSYALWPHMSVAENAGYSMRVAGAPKEEIRRAVAQALAVVGLSGFEDRMPAQLSGGQRQRVALARCLVQSPALVLLDEPLANLDVHLRASMEDEFADFHRRTGSTMIYITHDQAEAMALADRIAVMDEGRIVQVASPQELHGRPATAMVARFIGGGLVLPGEARATDGDGACRVRVLGLDVRARCAGPVPPGPVQVALYPRDLRLCGPEGPGIDCRVTRVVYQGGEFRVELVPEGAPGLRLTLHAAESGRPAPGDAVRVSIDGAWVIPGP